MGAILGSEVIQQASVLLEDRANKTWTVEELLGWLNFGQNAIVMLRPDAKTRVRSVQLVAGTRQALASPDLRVLDIPRNMGSGDVPGRAIRFIERRELDLEDPDWHLAANASAVVRHWMYDQAVPNVWWCYPAQPSSNMGHVEIITSATPEPVTISGVAGGASSTAIDIDDLYVNPLVAWIVYRAFSRDTEYAQPGGKAELAQREFFQFFGIKTESDKRFRPEKANPPFHSPPQPGNQGAFGDR